MTIYIRQALDVQKKALSQSLRLFSGEHSQNQNIAPLSARKEEIRKHLKLNKASDESLVLGITSIGSRGLSRYSLFLKRVRTKMERAGR
ncbi:hypothetical protein HEP89_27465 (plasmid) [Labrenzia sp. 5N]|uniref:hypothetical protein n=1 Tax=Labrenzia sp. 5N TaxID=2723402 RepID=UPI0014458F5F|nr:hypothetical protein [Labrenzia sp. 5N]NKX67874.1 hypothetical protein [Labrenzia sp. 5N]